MKQQKKMFQTKEQDKVPEEQLSHVEVGNLPEKEYTGRGICTLPDAFRLHGH